jgi:hypothetical protein
VIDASVGPDISKYAGPSDLTGKDQAGPTMFTAYRSESMIKFFSLLRSGNNFLFVGSSNSVLVRPYCIHVHVSNHESFVPNNVGPLSQTDFFHK